MPKNGLKIRRASARGGSTPPPGTIYLVSITLIANVLQRSLQVPPYSLHACWLRCPDPKKFEGKLDGCPTCPGLPWAYVGRKRRGKPFHCFKPLPAIQDALLASSAHRPFDLAQLARDSIGKFHYLCTWDLANSEVRHEVHY